MSVQLMIILMRVLAMFWLIVANGIFVFRYTRRKNFLLRLVLVLIGAMGLSTLVGWCGYEIMMASFSNGGWNLWYFAIINSVTHYILYGISIGSMVLLFDEKLPTVMFGSIAGYATENIAMTVNNIFAQVFPQTAFFSTFQPVTALSACVYLACYIGTYLVIFFAFSKPFRNDIAEVAKMNSGSTVVLFITTLIVAVAARAISASYVNESTMLYVLMSICDIFCCIIILFVQFLLTKKMLEKRDSDTILQLQDMQLKQYEFTKENIDIINLKCHDLKHQILALKNRENIDKEYLKKLSDSMTLYDSVISTGNDALDIVITDKNLFCVNNDITLTVIVEKDVLSFMAVSDIYSFFGNALDNAIEYVMTLPPEKRFIKLNIKKTGNLVVISVKNRYEGLLPEFVDGLPVTTKKDSTLHGFGVKSMKMVAERYGGSFLSRVEENQFIISVLITLK